MKTKPILLVLSLSFFLIGCEKQDINNPEVENYVDLLKSGQYNLPDLPEFQPSDIPALLIFRNDTASITNFPKNGISSFWIRKCKLGMYILWTIESIRAVEINSEYLIGRFPSQNPALALRDDPATLVFDNESHLATAKAYYDWWRSNPIFKNKMKIDPLKDTKYIWH
jgi:hypothetical protein